MSQPSDIKKMTRRPLREDFSIPTDAEWREAVEKLLKGKDFDKIMLTPTYEEITLQPQYRQTDINKTQISNNFPGTAPFLRGTHPGGYKSKPWIIAQEITDTDPRRYNEALLHDLKRGQEAVYLIADQAGAEGYVFGTDDKIGKNGTSIFNYADFKQALNDVDLEKQPVYIRPGLSAIAFTAMLNRLAADKGQDLQNINGAIEFDPIGQLLKSGQLPTDLNTFYDEMAHLTNWSAKHAPHLQTIAVDGSVFGDSGASAVQEVAYAVATAVEYLRQMMARGLAIDTVAPRIRFVFSIGSNLFMEMAKFRAVKLIWHHIVNNLSGNEESGKIHIHARSTSFNKTVLDPYVNILRTTTEGFAAVLGGIESMHLGFFNDLYNEANTFSRRIARNQQLILKKEANLGQLIDPAGGSWYVENLTAQLSDKIWTTLQEIEADGGMAQAVINGIPQKAINAVYEKRLVNLRKRKDIVLGSNMYPNPADVIPVYKTEKETDAFIDQRLKMKRSNDSLALDKTKLIDDLTIQIDQTDLAQISASLWDNKTMATAEALKTVRAAGLFEQLRKAMDDHKKKHGKALQICLVNLGPVSNYKSRADFTKGFFEVGGFEVIYPDGAADTDSAVANALQSGARIFVICGNDAEYPETVPKIVQGVRTQKDASTMVLAGFPKAQVEQLKAAGIDEFIHVRADIYAVLSTLMTNNGVTL